MQYALEREKGKQKGPSMMKMMSTNKNLYDEGVEREENSGNIGSSIKKDEKGQWKYRYQELVKAKFAAILSQMKDLFNVSIR